MAPSSPAAREAVETLNTVVGRLSEGGEARHGQRSMVAAVADTIDRENHIVVQAGTGTGKTLGYLIPAILSGRRVLVVTATKALQDQLDSKDLPFLRDVFETEGQPVTWAVVKGRSNYVCKAKLDAINRKETAGHQSSLDLGAGFEDNDDTDPETLQQIMEWAERTGTGDRAELTFEPDSNTWSAVSMTSTECPGAKKCVFGKECFAEKARTEAKEARIVVANMHLWGSYLGMGRDMLAGDSLEDDDVDDPAPKGVVVVDECHETEDVLAATLGLSVGTGRVRYAAKLASRVLTGDAPGRKHPAVERLETETRNFEKKLKEHAGARLTGEEIVTNFGAELTGIVSAALSIQAAVGNLPANMSEQTAVKAASASKNLEALVREIERVLRADGLEEAVWVEAGDHPKIHVAPTDVSGPLAKMVWSQHIGVLTSATVPPGITRRLGMPTNTSTIDVGSPFNYRENSLLYVPRIPGPREKGWREAVHQQIETLVLAAGGRTMALFTSYTEMRAAVEHLRPKLPYRVLVQGEAPKPALVDQFKSDLSSCLFATLSFWTGVDVPGDACNLVILDKVPFPRPDDPLWSARREKAGDAAFMTVDVPRAAALLAQGAGRLIRTSNDRGVVVVLDKRLAEDPPGRKGGRSYRHTILDALPPMRRTRTPEEVHRFLRELNNS